MPGCGTLLLPRTRNKRNKRNISLIARTLMFHIKTVFRNMPQMWNTKLRINSGMFHVFRVFRLIRGVGNTTPDR